MGKVVASANWPRSLTRSCRHESACLPSDPALKRLGPKPLHEVRGRADARGARPFGAHSAGFGADYLRSGLWTRQQRRTLVAPLPRRKHYWPRHVGGDAGPRADARATSTVRQAEHRRLGACGAAEPNFRQWGVRLPLRPPRALPPPRCDARARRRFCRADAVDGARILACADADGRRRRALVVTTGAGRQDPAPDRRIRGLLRVAAAGRGADRYVDDDLRPYLRRAGSDRRLVCGFCPPAFLGASLRRRALHVYRPLPRRAARRLSRPARRQSPAYLSASVHSRGSKLSSPG